MNTPYEPLRRYFHRSPNGHVDLAQELDRRRDSPASLRWTYRVGEHPLFAFLTTEVSGVIEQIYRRELQIQLLWHSLPAVAKTHYLRNILITEIHSTNDIEGIRSTRQEIQAAIAQALEGEKSGNPRFRELASVFLNLFPAEPPRGITNHMPTTLDALRDLYNTAIAPEILPEDLPDGQRFRSKPVFINDGVRVIHQGDGSEESINHNLSILLESLTQRSDNLLARRIAEHFMLEHTHPFYDGNGRFGRLLLALGLQAELSAPTALSLSAQIMRQKAAYYRAFSTTEDPLNCGDVTPFLLTMLNILANAQQELADSLVEKESQLQTMQDNIGRLDSTGSFTGHELPTLTLLGQVELFGNSKYVSYQDVNDYLTVSTPTSRAALTALKSRGLVERQSHNPALFWLSAAGKRELLEATD